MTDGRLLEFLVPTALTAVTREISAAAIAATAGLSPDAAAEAISARVREHVTDMPGATGVRTNAQQAWDKGQGVCQDMAQLTLALLRAVGLPARYVSGYLHPRADAEPGSTAVGQSHAWVEYWAAPESRSTRRAARPSANATSSSPAAATTPTSRRSRASTTVPRAPTCG